MKKNILKRSLSLLAGAVLAAVLAVSAPAAGVHAAQAGLDQVSVSASSTVKVSPDMAQVVFAVESEGADPATAQAQTSQISGYRQRASQPRTTTFIRSTTTPQGPMRAIRSRRR